MSRRLEDQLSEHGCVLDVNAFRTLLMDTLTGYPVIISFDSRYLNGIGFLDVSGLKSLSIR